MFVILSLRRILLFLPLRFFAKEAQNDRMRVQNDKVAAQCDREFVILNAVKDLAFFIIRFFAKEAQNDRPCAG
jgi:hypothetical protein